MHHSLQEGANGPSREFAQMLVESLDHFMTESTASVALRVAAAYDFSATGTLVDV